MYISNFLVHPSHREGFPNVLLEAGAMGTPILCSKATGNIDIVKMLLQKNMDVNSKDIHEFTPLILSTKNGNLEICKLLLVVVYKL